MKKLLLKISTCLLMLVCIVSATACGSKNAPLLDFEKARANLKEKGYTVYIFDYETGSGSDYYGELECFYAENEDDEWIDISRFKNKELAKKCYQQEKAEAEQEIKALKAEIEYYEAALKHCKNELDPEEIEFLQDAIIEHKKEILEYETELELSGVSGVYVWHGTKYAIKDTK